jgi:hypothetical protein
MIFEFLLYTYKENLWPKVSAYFHTRGKIWTTLEEYRKTFNPCTFRQKIFYFFYYMYKVKIIDPRGGANFDPRAI